MKEMMASQCSEKTLFFTKPRVKVALLQRPKRTEHGDISSSGGGGEEYSTTAASSQFPSPMTTQGAGGGSLSQHRRFIDSATVPAGYWTYPAQFGDALNGDTNMRGKRLRGDGEDSVDADELDGGGRPTVPVLSQQNAGGEEDMDREILNTTAIDVYNPAKIFARAQHLSTTGDEIEHRPVLRRPAQPMITGGVGLTGRSAGGVPDWRDLDASFYATRKAAIGGTDYRPVPFAAVSGAIRSNKLFGNGTAPNTQQQSMLGAADPLATTQAITTKPTTIAGLVSSGTASRMSSEHILALALAALQPPKHSYFTEAQKYEFHSKQQLMLAADLSSGSAAKHYNTVTRDQVTNLMTKLPATRRNLYAVVDPQLPCDPFFDLDVDFASHPEIVALIQQHNLRTATAGWGSSNRGVGGAQSAWTTEAEAAAKDSFVLAAVQFLSAKLVEFFAPEEKRRRMYELEHYLALAFQQLQSYLTTANAAAVGGKGSGSGRGFADLEAAGGSLDLGGLYGGAPFDGLDDETYGVFGSGDLVDLSEPPTEAQQAAVSVEVEEDDMPAAATPTVVVQPSKKSSSSGATMNVVSLEDQRATLLDQAREAEVAIRVDKVTVLDASTEGKKWSFHLHFKLSSASSPPATIPPCASSATATASASATPTKSSGEEPQQLPQQEEEVEGAPSQEVCWTPIYFEDIEQCKHFATRSLMPLQEEVNALFRAAPEVIPVEEKDAVPSPSALPQGKGDDEEPQRATMPAPVSNNNINKETPTASLPPPVDVVLTDALDQTTRCVLSCIDLAVYSKWRCFRLPLCSKRTGPGQCGATLYPWRPSSRDLRSSMSSTLGLQVYPDSFYMEWQRASAGGEASPTSRQRRKQQQEEDDDEFPLDSPHMMLERLVSDCLITPPVHEFADRLELELGGGGGGGPPSTGSLLKFSVAAAKGGAVSHHSGGCCYGKKAAFAPGQRVGVTETERRALIYIFRHLCPQYSDTISSIRAEFEDNGVIRGYYVYQKQSKFCYALQRNHSSTYGQLYLTYGSLKFKCYSNDCHAKCATVRWEALSEEVQRLKSTVLFPDLGDAETKRRYGDYWQLDGEAPPPPPPSMGPSGEEDVA